MRTLRIRIPEQMYLAASGPAVERSRRAVVFKAQAAKGEPRPERRIRSEEPAKRQPRASRRRLELPQLPKKIITDQILLQPRSPSELLPQAGLRLPELFFWAPPPPRQPVRPFVRPGHDNPPQARMRLDAPPRLEAPSPNIGAAAPRALSAAVLPYAPFVRPGAPEPQPARMRMDSPPELQGPGPSAPLFASRPTPAPADGVPPAMPVRTMVSEHPQPAEPVVDTAPGDPVNVLALSTRSLPVREFVTVPPGNQVAETAGGRAGSALSGPGGSGSGRQDEAGDATGRNASSSEGNSRSDTTPSPADPARNPDAAMPVSPNQRVVASATKAAGSATPVSPRAVEQLPGVGSAALKAAIEATRVVHPSNGVFDVVVQSSGPEGFPESAGVLSSKPVYSVYLKVGARRDWILQYCVPAGESRTAQVSEGVVRLGTPSRLNAPFPLTTYRPPSPQQTGKYLMFHGFISAQGRFEELRPLGSNDPSIVGITSAALERWEFRPATQDGRPLRVEVLLAIPPE